MCVRGARRDNNWQLSAISAPLMRFEASHCPVRLAPEFSTLGARYARYELLSRPRAGVTLVSGSVGGIQCAVGVDNKGPNLYEDGSVKRSGY